MKTATGILFVAFYVLLTFCACKEDGMAGVETLASVKEVSIPNVGKVNEAFSIDLIMFGTSRGSEFSWFESSSQADTTTFELYQWRDKGLMCATSIIEINVAIVGKLSLRLFVYLQKP